ncbi:MAG: phage major capsid protein [Lachnospiraceae bacterium]|nr:phage major capsid protein [Lachnospiraceae bacterium]
MDKFKKLREEREAHKRKLQEMLDKAETEERALTDAESEEFDQLEAKIKGIDRTIKAEERARGLSLNVISNEKREELQAEERAAAEERAFEDYIRGVVSEERADVNLTKGDNGAVIPSSIANKIIEKVEDICPIYQMAEHYNVGGTLSIPYYDETDGAIEMAYATEFEDLISTSGKFKSIELKGFLAGVLTKISKSLINNSHFNITNYVINKMAKAIVRWIEKECLNGTKDKIDGISKAKQVVTAAAADKITGDELIELQETIPDVYQPGCIWIMNKATRTAIRKLKDNDGNYLLNKDMTAKWGYTLLGAPVYCSDQVSKMAAGATTIIYGDMTGLAVKISEDMNIEVLREKFATQHAVGAVGWLEMDAKIQDEQKIAVLKMKASTQSGT